MRFEDGPLLQDIQTKTAEKLRKAFFNTMRRWHLRHQARLARQSYPGYQSPLYPTLPLPSHNYPYQPHRSSNQTIYTPPYNPQWQPNNMHNLSRPNYTGYNPSYNNPYTNQGSHNPYNPAPSAPTAPRPPNINPGYRNNSRPHIIPGYQPYSSTQQNTDNYNPGYQPSYGFGKNISVYNPSPRPPYYPSGNNSFNPHQPAFPTYTQRYPFSYYNTTTQRILNNFPNQSGGYNISQTGYSGHLPGNVMNSTYINYPGYPNRAYSSNPYRPYNNTTNSPQPGYGSTSLYSTPFPTTHQVNNPYINQGQPSYPGQNNFTRPNLDAGYYPYGHTNQNISNHRPTVQANVQLPGMFNPQYQYNGTSTYRLADHYTPNIPSQPPPKNNYGHNNMFYPSNPAQDPTRVAPERFSY